MEPAHPHDLSRTERRTFQAVVRAALGVVDGREADAIAPFLRRMPAAERRQLRSLLRTFEYSAPVLTLRARRFSALSPERAERYLLRWATSRVRRRRQAASVLRLLAAVAHYGLDAAWPGIGYDGPWLDRVAVPALPEPPGLEVVSAKAATAHHSVPKAHPVPGILRGRDLRGDLELRTQVCVIGTGAGGAAAVARLVERGIDVVAVEAGGHLPAEACTQREHEMMPRMFRQAGLRATADHAIGILQGTGVGGSTLHNTGLAWPLPPGIAERWRREYGFALEGGALDSYTNAALKALHASPIADAQVNANNGVLRRGADVLGWHHRRPLHTRVDCCGCGYCIIGCAYNRKTNAAFAFLPQAIANGASILADAAALGIEGPSGARRVVCSLEDGEGNASGHRAVVHARAVVLAAGALDTPALLLRSGLGNRNVGRGLRLHPSALVGALFQERIEAWRGLPQSVIVDEFATFLRDGYGGFLLLALSGPPGLAATLVPGLGTLHRERMLRYAHAGSAAVMLHDETNGRVKARRDGTPRARYWPEQGDLEELHRGIGALAKLFFAAGAEEVVLPYLDAPAVKTSGELDAALARGQGARYRLALNAVHPQGSVPFGRTATDAAVTPVGRLWGQRDLFVADASLFPTSVGGPPQVPVMTLAMAVADHVAAAGL
jgi:choline dehydrogenase-like flavoprotein